MLDFLLRFPPEQAEIMARVRGKLYRCAMTVLASFKARAAELKREVLAVYLAAKHPRTPWYSKLVIVAIVAYVLSPIDLIPDFIPVLGLLDEIILLPLALLLVVKLVPEDVMAECRARALERRAEGTALGRLGAAFVVLVWLALIVLALMWVSGAARAQGWPAKPIRLVSPFPPGAVVDTLCRTLAPPLGEALGQPVVVENRAGAGGNVGMDFVAKAPADGYTLGMGGIATHGINPSVYARMPFDPVRDFAPVTFVASNINVLVVHPSVPANDVRQLVDYARTHPGKLAFGSAGAGTSQHLAGELFKQITGVEMTHVPYKGAGPAVSDLLGGQIPLMFVDLSATLAHIRAGKLRALAVLTRERTPLLEVPTAIEQGIAGLEVNAWFGLFAPAGTPPELVARLNGATAATLRLPATRERLESLGLSAAPGAPEELARLVRVELERWAKVAKAANLKPE
jgi:tripartite-type tricarboxylate transporter receptor subunit TctC/uncharacterized membrane protein YkvA (DUF1232 family)